ncbi:MAG: aldehyde-activating protein [Acidimicrobiaceae bacterium]|nr:aldehyde-activating protein [Acidimicrobiaceae bacterium]MDP7598770.1 GFA family protein [Acidimicrobiales bacterium]
MNDPSPAGASGGCHCGGVRYRVKGPLREVINCHCEPCRRITGHFMAGTDANLGEVEFDADETLTWYHPTDTVQYGFCNWCGSTLFWRADDKASRLSISAGTLDQPTGLTTGLALFGDEAGDYHNLDTTIETLPGDH